MAGVRRAPARRRRARAAPPARGRPARVWRRGGIAAAPAARTKRERGRRGAGMAWGA